MENSIATLVDLDTLAVSVNRYFQQNKLITLFQCIPGYYGNPSAEGGSCQSCACHPYGSINNICDRSTGQCLCQPGVTGRDCSSCSPRHAFMNRVCTCKTFNFYLNFI